MQTVSVGHREGLNLFNLILFIAIALFTIVSIVFMYQGQRRIPVQQARRVVGRKMFAGRSTYIRLRLNNAGVISIIFAISILLLPQQMLTWFNHGNQAARFVGQVSAFIDLWFRPSGWLYNRVYFVLAV